MASGMNGEHGSALDSVRVTDMSRLVAGNMTTLVLADFGADVIKVEHPEKGDDLRRWRSTTSRSSGNRLPRNKRSIAPRPASPGGAFDVRAAGATTAGLVENFVPGTLGSGASARTAAPINPGW